MAQNFLSNEIKVYPSSKRSDYYDRNARLNSEQNLISTVNRLTRRTAFVIDGLNIENGKLQSGSCNIHGYLFTFNFPEGGIEITETGNNINNYLFLHIVTKRTVLYSSATNSIEYNELDIIDANNISGTGTDTTAPNILDGVDESSSSSFKGIELIAGGENLIENTSAGDTTANSTIFNWYLAVGQWDGSNKWVTIESNDSVGGSRWNILKYNADDIYIEASSNNKASSYYNQPQDLVTWLENNFIIDDGRIS